MDDNAAPPLSPIEATIVTDHPMQISDNEVKSKDKDETKQEFDDEELRRANQRAYFPKFNQLANLLRSDDTEARIQTAALVGHTLDRSVYAELVFGISGVRGDTQTRFVHAKAFAMYLEMSTDEFHAHEPLLDVYSASALRFLRLFTMEIIDTVPERSMSMYRFIQKKYAQSIPELERSVVVEDMARYAPLGHPNPKQWLQQNKMIAQTETRDTEFEYVACIWRYAQWYKYMTTVDWIGRYYIPWHELATTKFRERIVEETLNTKPRRPLIICAGRECAWLVHCHTTRRLYRCADSLMALCVWTQLVSSKFDGVDNFNKKIPVLEE